MLPFAFPFAVSPAQTDLQSQGRQTGSDPGKAHFLPLLLSSSRFLTEWFISAAQLDMSSSGMISELSGVNLPSSFLLNQNPSEFCQRSRFQFFSWEAFG